MRFAVSACVVLAVGTVAAAEFSLDGGGWTCDGVAVCVPHTWNEPDGADGLTVPKGQSGHNSVSSRSYLRKAAVYRRTLPDPKAGKRYFLRFCFARVRHD